MRPSLSLSLLAMANRSSIRFRAPCQGTALQRVRIPPGNCSFQPLCGVFSDVELGRKTLAASHFWRNSLHITPLQGRSVAWPRGGCRKPRRGAGVARRSPSSPSVRQVDPPLPASGGRPAPGAPSGAARARTLALRPGTGRAGTAADAAPTQLQDAWRPGGLGARRGPEQRLAKRAKDLALAMNPAFTSSPSGLPGSGGSAADRRGRVRPRASRAPSRRGVQRPPRAPGQADTRRGPPHRSRPPAACADDAVTIRRGHATTG